MSWGWYLVSQHSTQNNIIMVLVDVQILIYMLSRSRLLFCYVLTITTRQNAHAHCKLVARHISPALYLCVTCVLLD